MDLTPPQPQHTHTPTEQASETFSDANFIVVKLTDYCNLRCKYCHQDALNGKPILMPMETFKNAVRLVLKPAKAPVVYVQFHGGEPLLAPDEFFYEAVEFCKQELETDDRKVQFYIQTNFTKVTPAKVKMLKELQIGVSFSLDGPPEINDELRGGGRRIVQNWRDVKKVESNMGTICLIQPSNWDRMEEVVEFFEKEEIHSARFNLMVPDGRGKDCNTANAEKLFKAKKYVFDYMLDTKGQKVFDASLHTAMKKFMKSNGSPSSYEYHGCESLYCQAGRSLFSINPDGSFYACDRIAENPTWAMGNVNQPFGSREKAMATRMRKKFHHKDDWWARCEGCDAKKICEFSCSAYYVDKVDTRDVECQYTKMLYSYFVEKKEDVREFMKSSVKPIFIDEKKPLIDQDEETWAIKDIAADAEFNQVGLTDTLALNKYFQLFQRGEQYYVYLFKKAKIYEVDEVVAEIAQYNGMLPPKMVEQALDGRYPAGQIGKTIKDMTQVMPEVFLSA